MHHRSCRVIKGLAGETFEIQPERNTVIDDTVLIKAGVKLPKSFDQRKLANDYFTAALPIADITTCNLPTIISNMNNVSTVILSKSLEW